MIIFKGKANGGEDEPDLGVQQEARLVGRQRGQHAQTRPLQHEASAPSQASLELA
jgi:hypothetical protein